jgi:hypothetical protein
MAGEPYVVTFRALGGSGGSRRTYTYKIKNALSGTMALEAARHLADTETERAARGGLELDRTWHEVTRVRTLLGFGW